MNRKAIIFLPDGMADNPLPEFQNRTPLEIARTPGMDKIASLGINGNFLTLPENLPTSSDVANMSVLGFQPELNYPGRGPIEAVAQDIQLAPDDIAWRCNLVYASNDGILRDYSAGHISDEDARILMEDLQKEFTWRNRRKGDVILRGKMHRQVRRLWAEKGIVTEMRQMLPLLCRGEEIVWAPFVGMSDDLKENCAGDDKSVAYKIEINVPDNMF